MQSFLIWFLASFSIATIVGSFFEWSLHRFVMHRPVGKFEYAYRAHTHVHHKVFKADHTYHLIHDHDKATIPMAWWNGPVLITIFCLPFLAASFVFGTWAIILGAFLAFVGYYGAYEYIHWCMHLPKARRLERSWFFRRLNGHHLLHHRYMRKNFNVVLPLADLCLGTLMVRSKMIFSQPTGPAVPSVQPRHRVPA